MLRFAVFVFNMLDFLVCWHDVLHVCVNKYMQNYATGFDLNTHLLCNITILQHMPGHQFAPPDSLFFYIIYYFYFSSLQSLFCLAT